MLGGGAGDTRVRVTHVSGRLLQVLVVHVRWDGLRGQRARGVGLRELPFKLRLDEVQLPAEEEEEIGPSAGYERGFECGGEPGGLLGWQKEAAGEPVPLFAHAHADGPALGHRVKSRVLGDAMEFRVKV